MIETKAITTTALPDRAIETQIMLDDVNKVKEFVRLANTHQGNVTLYSDIYVVDGKSIMGVFSLDLMQPITVKVFGDVSTEFMVGLSRLIAG